MVLFGTIAALSSLAIAFGVLHHARWSGTTTTTGVSSSRSSIDIWLNPIYEFLHLPPWSPLFDDDVVDEWSSLTTNSRAASNECDESGLCELESFASIIPFANISGKLKQ